MCLHDHCRWCRCAAFYCELVKALDFSVGSHETLSELAKVHLWEDPANDVPTTDAFAGYDSSLAAFHHVVSLTRTYLAGQAMGPTHACCGAQRAGAGRK